MILLSLILFPVVANAQSLAEAAKQQRARLCKEGKTQYCDGGPQKAKPKRVVDDSWMEQSLSYQATEENLPSSNAKQQSLGDDIGTLQKKVDDLSHPTARQLADSFVGDVQFPGRDKWEQELDEARNRFVSSEQAAIDLLHSDKATSGAMDSARYDIRLAANHYTDVQAKGQSLAADWKRKTENSTSSKSEPKQPRGCQ